MPSPLTSVPLSRFLTLIPDSHSHRNQVTESAIVDSRTASQTDLSVPAGEAGKINRADSSSSTDSTDSSKSVGGFSFLKLGN